MTWKAARIFIRTVFQVSIFSGKSSVMLGVCQQVRWIWSETSSTSPLYLTGLRIFPFPAWSPHLCWRHAGVLCGQLQYFMHSSACKSRVKMRVVNKKRGWVTKLVCLQLNSKLQSSWFSFKVGSFVSNLNFVYEYWTEHFYLIIRVGIVFQ